MKGMFRRYFEIHSFNFSISTRCRELEAGLASLYPALSSAPGKCSAEWSVESRKGRKKTARSYLSYEDGNLIHQTQSIEDALDYLEWRITTRILQNLKQFIQIHAAGVERGGKALLLVGPSGSGKSSLALCLLRRGWKCMSDEVVLLDAGCGSVLPFPRSFHADFSAMKIFHDLVAKQGDTAFRDSSGKMRLDPSFALEDWVAEPSPPGWIVFPDYQPGHSGEIEPVGETEALSLMLSQAINLAEHGKRGLDALMELVRSLQCFRLTTGDLNVATSLLTGVTEQVRMPVYQSARYSGCGFVGEGVQINTAAGGSHE